MYITFVSPIDGDVMNAADGYKQAESLIIPVKISAPVGATVTVNGKPATFADGFYTAEAKLDGYRNTVTARAELGGDSVEQSIVLFRFMNAYKKYRLSIDDVVWAFKQLAEGDYPSVFDHPFFAIFKRVREDFGTKTQLNLYYEDVCSDFNLTQMPDKYKAEFEAASDWLKLTFHALRNTPDRIYRFTPYDVMYEHYRKTTREIIRFAGKNVMQAPTNGLHWAETTREGARALRAVGIRCLVGYFTFDEDGNPHISYYLDKQQTKHAASRDFWVDTKEDIIFSKDTIVLDEVDVDKIGPFLDNVKKDPHSSGMINLLTHEQYFHSFYPYYLADYEERIRAGVKWATDNGYEPIFLHEAIEEKMPTDFD